jgi:hypothetical protein
MRIGHIPVCYLGFAPTVELPYTRFPSVRLVSAICSVGGIPAQRRSVQADLLPQEHRLLCSVSVGCRGGTLRRASI